MVSQGFKTNSYSIAGCHYASAENNEADKTGSKFQFNNSFFVRDKKPITVNDKTIEVEGLGQLLKATVKFPTEAGNKSRNCDGHFLKSIRIRY